MIVMPAAVGALFISELRATRTGAILRQTKAEQRRTSDLSLLLLELTQQALSVSVNGHAELVQVTGALNTVPVNTSFHILVQER